jgi:hypothetical protein
MTEAERYRMFVMIEIRGLVPLLRGESLRRYEEFLELSEDYQRRVREQVITEQL